MCVENKEGAEAWQTAKTRDDSTAQDRGLTWRTVD